jgi:hypothetical protein
MLCRLSISIVFLGLFGLIGAACASEPSLQEVLDSLGFSIDVSSDEVSIPAFALTGQQAQATVLAQYAGYAGITEFGWYDTQAPGAPQVLFPANPGGLVGQQTTFLVDRSTSVGFYISVTDKDTWHTQDSLNSDAAHHCKVFPTILYDGDTTLLSYVLAWEDLPNLGDRDYQDMIVRIDGFGAVPEPNLCSIVGLLLSALGVAGHAARHRRKGCS